MKNEKNREIGKTKTTERNTCERYLHLKLGFVKLVLASEVLVLAVDVGGRLARRGGLLMGGLQGLGRRPCGGAQEEWEAGRPRGTNSNMATFVWYMFALKPNLSRTICIWFKCRALMAGRFATVAIGECRRGGWM